jgi:prepilin-type N-terminal cleavage/methylation domain-containing protein
MRTMYQRLNKNNGFTMMEFVVTVAILGTMLSVALPSYHSTTLMVQEKTSLSKMHMIRETFFQYFYRAHMDRKTYNNYFRRSFRTC